MPDEPIYLDYAATAPLRAEAREAFLVASAEAWGNPSSLHSRGRRARAVLEEARARLAALLCAEPAEILFTRGGTESDNLAVLGRHGARPVHEPMFISAVEHRAVLASAEAAAAGGRPVRRLPVDRRGVLELDPLAAAVDETAALVSVMWASNETGVLQPVEDVARFCREIGVAVHSDAVQAFGKLPIRVDRVPIDLLSVSAHKVGGPRGMGALFLRRGTTLTPLLHGGGQERGLRPGTEDVAGAAAFVAAAEVSLAAAEGEWRRLAGLRDRLEAELLARIPGLVVNGAGADRLPGFCNISLPGADPELLLAALDGQGIAASSGSACSSGSVTPSHVLLAMGLPEAVAGPSLRFSMGPDTTAAHIERVIGVLPGIAERVSAH